MDLTRGILLDVWVIDSDPCVSDPISKGSTLEDPYVCVFGLGSKWDVTAKHNFFTHQGHVCYHLLRVNGFF
jgi:hypothetical protein